MGLVGVQGVYWVDPLFITREARIGAFPEATPFIGSGSCESQNLAVETHIRAREGEKWDSFDLALFTQYIV